MLSADSVRFERTKPCGLLVFKTSGISQTLPAVRTEHLLGGGLDPILTDDTLRYGYLADSWFKTDSPTNP